MPPTQTCYRHPAHKAGVTCQRCDNPICPSCMVTASVGFHCPECAGIRREGTLPANQAVDKGTTKQSRRTARPWHKYSSRIGRDHPSNRGYSRGYDTNAGRYTSLRDVPFCAIILATNIIVFIFTVASWGGLWAPDRVNPDDIRYDYGLAAVLLENGGEWWRIFTSGFLHSSILHVAFNMLIFWIVGRGLEPHLGSIRFALLYLSSIVGGAFGVILLESESTLTVGASGGVFGLMGAHVVLTKMGGGRVADSPIAFLLFINLALTFVLGGISVGGHLGGLATGVLIGLVYGLIQKSLLGSRHSAKNLHADKDSRSFVAVLMTASGLMVGGLLFLGCLLVTNSI